MAPIIEVCVDSVESALAAVCAGADRLEICGNLAHGGGTTPSLGLVEVIQRTVPDTPVMVMVRPRVGDFIYTKAELNVMLEDIKIFKRLGVTGIVFGVLDCTHAVNVSDTQMLVKEALPLEVCFHRAFDMTTQTVLALRQVLEIGGITRILTSGHGTTAPTSIDNLKLLLNNTQNVSLTILPGSGVNATNVLPFIKELLPYGLREIHLSGGQWLPSQADHHSRPIGMGMGVGEGEWGIWRTNEETIRRVREIVDDGWNEFIGGRT